MKLKLLAFLLFFQCTAHQDFFYSSPFISLEMLLENSEELRLQYELLTQEERNVLIEAINEFNNDIQQAFHALIEQEPILPE